MDKLEAVQRVLRFSDRIREWVESEHNLHFDDFDNYNVDDYEDGYGEIADVIIQEGMKDGFIDEEDLIH